MRAIPQIKKTGISMTKPSKELPWIKPSVSVSRNCPPS